MPAGLGSERIQSVNSVASGGKPIGRRSLFAMEHATAAAALMDLLLEALAAIVGPVIVARRQPVEAKAPQTALPQMIQRQPSADLVVNTDGRQPQIEHPEAHIDGRQAAPEHGLGHAGRVRTYQQAVSLPVAQPIGGDFAQPLRLEDNLPRRMLALIADDTLQQGPTVAARGFDEQSHALHRIRSLCPCLLCFSETHVPSRWHEEVGARHLNENGIRFAEKDNDNNRGVGGELNINAMRLPARSTSKWPLLAGVSGLANRLPHPPTELSMRPLPFYDRSFSRRRFLEVGGVSLLGLGLPDWLRARAQAGEQSAPARAVIFMYLQGGLSPYETYDPKPDAPDVWRGPFATIRTKVPGIHFGEMIPEQAKVADKMVVLRSLHHRYGDHPAAVHLWKTGYPGAKEPDRQAMHPSVAAVAAKVLSDKRRDLPASVIVPYSNPTTYDGPVYLGAEGQPLTVDLNLTSLLAVTDSFRLPRGVTPETFENRRQLLRQFDTMRRDLDWHNQMPAVDTFRQKAFDLVLGDTAQRALDLTQENDRIRDRYGRNFYGQATLLARRLVEAGVPFVTVNSGGNVFDHHERLVELMRKELPPVDQAVAALINDLDQRGLLEHVLVCVLTDFGRDQMNNIAGRHHWADCGCAMLAGGGLRLGQIVGASDRNGRYPVETPLQPADVLAVIYHHLGIPLDTSFPDFTGRPIAVNNGGQLIRQVLG